MTFCNEEKHKAISKCIFLADSLCKIILIIETNNVVHPVDPKRLDQDPDQQHMKQKHALNTKCPFVAALGKYVFLQGLAIHAQIVGQA